MSSGKAHVNCYDNPSIGWGSPFNAGVFAVKTGAGARCGVGEWLYMKDDWAQEEDRWNCTACGWSGCYEWLGGAVV